MNSVCITLSSVAIAIALWLAWLTGKPVNRPLLDRKSEQALTAMLPPDSEEGNTTATYTGFALMLDDLLADINAAQHHVHIQFFKFETDCIAQRIGDALATKAAQGVEVRLLYDDIVNKSHKWYYRTLSKQGVQVQGFAPVHIPFLRKQDNYRNHRKVVVIDGRTGYLGGMNIAERYLYGLDWGPWRDTQMRIKGPAVAQLQLAFLSDWCHATGQLLDRPAYFPKPVAAGNSRIQILTSGPLGNGPAIMHRTVQMLDQSQEYIYLESPYFIPTPEVMQALCRAAQRGVDVRLLLPARSDRGVLVLPASMSYVAQALDAGARIGLYRSGFLHAKTIVADDLTATVGSTNIDPRSYLLDHEIGAFVTDRNFALEIKRQFLADEAQSEYIDKTAWAHRPIHRKALERFARLFSSQL